MQRRRTEHNQKYRRSPQYTMPTDSKFEYDWYIPLSKYNTLRYEDKNREIWKQKEVGEYVRNDRFACAEKPAEVEITIRKTYKISL